MSGVAAGTRIAVRTSPAPSAVSNRPLKKSSAVNRAPAAGSGDLHLAAERQQAGGQFGRRIGERDRAADGAAVADRRMPDMRQRLRDQRRMPRHDRRGERRRVPHQRADLDLPVFDRDAVEPADAVDVDQQARRIEPHVERGDQALAAGQHARAVMRAERFDRMLERARFRIGEWRRLHAAPSSPWPPWRRLLLLKFSTTKADWSNGMPAAPSASSSALRSGLRPARVQAPADDPVNTGVGARPRRFLTSPRWGEVGLRASAQSG